MKDNDKFRYITAFRIPSLIVLLSLLWLVYISIQSFQTLKDFEEVIRIYLTILGLTIGLASVSFSYSKIIEDEQNHKIACIGECFLHSAISMIIAILISWFSINVKDAVKDWQITAYLLVLKIFVSILFGFGQLFLFYSARSLHDGLINLEEFLFFRLKNKGYF